MRPSRSAILVFCFLFSCALCAQVTNVPPSEAMKHVTKTFPPEYPPVASVANITGRVMVQVTISPEGKVTNARMITGHPLFETAAIRAVRLWRYEPFVVDGAAAPVTTSVYLGFWLGDPELRQRNMLQEVECRDLFQAKRFLDAATVCDAALQTAKKIKLQSDDPQWAGVHHALAVALVGGTQLDRAELEYMESEKAFDIRSKSLKRNKGSYSKETYARLETEL